MEETWRWLGPTTLSRSNKSGHRVRPCYSYIGRMKGLAELRGVIHSLTALRQ